MIFAIGYMLALFIITNMADLIVSRKDQKGRQFVIGLAALTIVSCVGLLFYFLLGPGADMGPLQ